MERTGGAFGKGMKNPPESNVPAAFSSGASDVTRTHDLLITNQLLYRLSYTSMCDPRDPANVRYLNTGRGSRQAPICFFSA